MNEWGVALIAAGSALAGSAVTGLFAFRAGTRQAEAARHAGDRQADAVLDTVRMTLAEQRAVRVLDLRRQTYVAFLDAAEAVILSRRTGEGRAGDRADLHRALGSVSLEGPPDVARAAHALVDALRGNRAPDDLEAARLVFVEAARTALDGAGPAA
ncbi:hypothetical protein [Streptomyces marincola]|uniref:Uncharacterized protein n=1 Tax=Streptomyces marincola TaxID=2878388 RepID=A0A1W7D4X8_9ACTN|nr:hypothetical protein [Streptomyces marincola]ARP51727.1 hypothetical protein [Streptomyces marincola]ARQ72007.1 hypothetical protein CAG99_27085 [Streptomyces marincola]